MFIKKRLPQKLNICLVAKTFPMLGRSREFGFLWPITRNLAQEHNITVISWSNPDEKIEIVESNVKAHYLYEKGKLSEFPQKALNKFLELNKHENFHIVHSIDDSSLQISLNNHLHNAAIAYDVKSIKMSQLFSLVGISNETLKGIITTSLTVAYTFFTTYFKTDRRLLKSAHGIFVSTPIQKKCLELYQERLKEGSLANIPNLLDFIIS